MKIIIIKMYSPNAIKEGQSLSHLYPGASDDLLKITTFKKCEECFLI